MVGEGQVASEGRLEQNPLLKGAGQKSKKVQAAAALFDSSSLWLVGMLRRYAALRLMMVFYLIWLHILVFFVLDWAVDMEQEEDAMEHKAA